MSEPAPDERDPRKVRAGLAIICAVVVAAVALFVVVDAPAGKALMFAVAATALVRAFLLHRWLRRTEAERRA
jgi:Na+/H+ antiporter NhaD/arsenite permease-like protein